MDCFIVKDLLPNFIDGLTSEETNGAINSHIAECAGCRAALEKMSAEFAYETEKAAREEKEIDFLKQFKSRIRIKKIVTVIAACFCVIAVISGALLYEFKYAFPMPYNSQCMKIKPTCVAELKTVDENGNVIGAGIRYFANGTEPDGLQDGETVTNILEIVQNFINTSYSNAYGREVTRNGEKIWVAYVCCYQTPYMKNIDKQYAGQINGEPGLSTPSGSYYSNLLDGGDKITDRQTIEIYYLTSLPRSDKKLQNLSDEEFAALGSNGILMWSGTK